MEEYVYVKFGIDTYTILHYMFDDKIIELIINNIIANNLIV